MFEYRIAVGKVTDMAEAAAAKKRQVELRGILHAQMQEREDQKRVEQNAAVDYFHKEQVRGADHMNMTI